MGQNSLLGSSKAATEAPGRDNAALGPSDTSDSGSDVAAVVGGDGTDPFAPVDVALDEDAQRPLHARGATPGADSDAAGSGERRSAANDGGERDGADIAVDRVIDPLHDDEDPDLAFMDGDEDPGSTLANAVAPDPMSDEAIGDDDDPSIDPAAARRSAMHDRERDVRLGRLHGKGKKPRPASAADD